MNEGKTTHESNGDRRCLQNKTMGDFKILNQKASLRI